MSFDPVAYLEEEDEPRQDWGDAGAARPPPEGFDPGAYLAEPEPMPAETIPPDPDLGIPQPVPEPAPKPTLSTEATLRGGVAHTLGGATFNWADELAGLAAKSRGQQRRPNSSDWSMGDLSALQPRIAQLVRDGVPFNEAAQQAAREFEDGEYKKGRDDFRRVQEDFREENPKTAFGLNVAGGALTGGAVRSAGKGAAARYAPTVIEGALGGAGASEEAEGMGTGAAFGATLGAGLQYVGSKAGGWLGGLMERMAARGKRGQEEARRLAEAMAARDVNKTVQSLRGEAGGAASRVGNAIKNIEEIALDPDHPSRTVGYLRTSLQEQIAKLEETVYAARQKAYASGIDPDDLGPGRIGEFIASGSKLDAAQQIAKKIATYEAALDTMRGKLQELAGRAADEIIPTQAPALMAEKAALVAKPAFLDVKENVLKNALSGFDDDATEAIARRAVYAQALEGKGEAIKQQTVRLLSGRAARERFGHLLLRYGPPAIGSIVGSSVGGAEGAAVGAVTGAALGGGMSTAIGALGGAGLRPAFQSLYRTATTYPAVQNVFWKGVESAAKSAPQFGTFAQELAEAAARSPEALGEVHARLSEAKGAAGEAYADFMDSVMEASKPDTSAMNDADLAAYLAEMEPEALGTFAAPLKKAAQDGKLSIAHYVLIQRDPNYRAALQAYRDRAGQTQSREPGK